MNFAKFHALTRFEQTLYALPTVIAAALFPFINQEFRSSFRVGDHLEMLLIVPAFLVARISGMAFNQLIDRKIDARNPRTATRPLPRGFVSVKEAAFVAWTSLALFFLVCFRLGFLCTLFSFVTAALIVIYSYLKRIHACCHFVIGMIHFLVPVMAWVAMTGSLELTPFILGSGAFFAIVGIEIVYATQDYEFDRKEGLHSLPVAIGVKKSLALAAWMHVFCVMSLVLLGIVARLSLIYYVAPLFTAGLFWNFYRKRPEMLNFFSCGVLFSLSLMIVTIAEIVWRVML